MAVNPVLACWDNPIRGLDSSSALDFLRLLKEMSRATGMTNVVTLYQASESMYQNCFDRTIVMYDGRMIFSGKVGEAKQYFQGLGFHCPERQTTPDFLTSITSPTERIIQDEYSGPLYLDPDSLAQAFRRSIYYEQLQSDLVAYSKEVQSNTEIQAAFRRNVGEVRSKMALKQVVEPSTIWKQVAVGTQRYYRLFWGDRNTFLTTLALCVVNALITGSGFYAAPRTASGSFERSGALFFALAYFCLNALTEVVKTVHARSILLKQHDMGFISPAAYAIIQTIADLPSALMQTLVFSCCYYFLIGLSTTASQFFIFVLLVFVHYSAISSMFRMLGAWAPSLSISHLLAGCALPVACLYSGYAPPVPTMHRWGSWIRRITPTPYAMEALIGNEFYNIALHCTDSQLIPSGPGYDNIQYQACPMQGAERGSALVDGAVYAQAMYGFTRSHLWRNFGIVLVMWFLYTVLGAVGLTITTRDNGSATGPVYKRSAGRLPESKSPSGLVIDQVEKQSDSTSSERNAASMIDQTTLDDGSPAPAKETESSTNGQVTFTFKKLNYFVNWAGEEKQLLCDVSGYVKPGQLTALMGASGAGKTTLLDNLSRRKAEGRMEGEILLNGVGLSNTFARSCGFCMQQDIHEPTATVREALQFSAHLRQPAHVPKEEKIAYVEHIISLLELEKIADALVGTAGDGQLNIEERKRVTIGVELAARPSALLFLDEVCLYLCAAIL
jgi:ABC-type multidrug transport system ATPase subunit